MAKRIGKQTVAIDDITIISSAAVVGPKEAQGPLAKDFDVCHNDSLLGEETFEKAESRLQSQALQKAISKAGRKSEDIDVVFAGDLLNQCIGSSFGLMNFNIPFIGMYGACSTAALSIGTAAVFVDSGAANCAAAVTSSHFCSSERQYRFPLEYGSVRTPTAQWTVTGAGAFILCKGGTGPKVKSVTFGKIEDLGVKDANNMGAAMAPAAASTIAAYFEDTGAAPQDFDAIYTGDLGQVGTDLLHQLLQKEGLKIEKQHRDCGLMIFDCEKQDVHAGGSGCGCSASVLGGHIIKKLQSGKENNILFCATGALLSPTSTQQGENVISIAHLINIKNR